MRIQKETRNGPEEIGDMAQEFFMARQRAGLPDDSFQNWITAEWLEVSDHKKIYFRVKEALALAGVDIAPEDRTEEIAHAALEKLAKEFRLTDEELKDVTTTKTSDGKIIKFINYVKQHYAN